MSTAVGELRRFVTFLGTFWGVLAGTAMLFPLANTFVGAIPIGKWDRYRPQGGLVYIPPEIVAATATLGACFTILWLFNHRHEFRAGIDRSVVRRRALVSFGVAVGALALYLVVTVLIFEGLYWRVLQWTGDNPLRIGGDLVLLLSYVGFFVLTTRAFVLLGMLEYYRTE
jgi:hypothetical protein